MRQNKEVEEVTMRGCWNLQEHELVFWKAYVETKINYLIENKDR